MSGSSAIGSVITISASALKAIDDVDKKLQSLQTTMTDTAKKANTEFTNMATATKSFSQALDDIITKMGKVGTSAQSIASSMQGAWGSITAGSGSAAVSVQQLANALKSMSGAGTSGVQSAALNFEKLENAAKNASGMNIAELKEYIKDINSLLNDKGNSLSTSEQDKCVSFKRTLEQELKYQLQTIEERKVAHQKAVDQMVSAEERLARKQQSLYKGNAASYQAQNYKANTTYSGSLQFSDTANTINRQTKAIEYLEAARKNLSRTDSDYEKKLQALNEAILKNKQALEAASTATTSKNARESYLSNTSQVLADTGSAKTLQQHTQAIKELEQARLRLNTTDANYKRNLASVNEAIRQHSQVLREAGVNANNLREQTSYLAQYIERWATRTAALFSVNFAQNAINQIVEVRGQFEMSQRSLEAILQDKSKADEIFNKTVELAVQSPFQIKDLVDYTRQLSAYRIESDKLYDTTKRLADVSAGLGVDMGRLILAYGQVKAAAYLRGSEVRQFTEAGINMYGELQSYFKEVKGEAYTTEQIVDMISKRMVSFADVEQVFQRMTDKGGTFYNMQSIQAETLQGKVANLEDSLDVMLNAIGKDNEGMLKGAVSAATELLNHWEGIATAAKGVAATMALMLVYAKQMRATKFTELFTANLGGSQTSLGALATMVNNTKGAINLLGASFKSAGGMIANFGKNLAGALVTNAPLVALTALVSALIEGYQIWSKWNNSIDKANEQMVESKGIIGSLAASYRDLSASAKSLEGDKLSENVSERKSALQKLIDAAAKDGLKLEINVETIDEAKLDQTFKMVEKKYADFVDTLNVVQKNHADSQRWDTWFTDGIGDDMADYKDAVVDALATQSKLEAVISNINANYTAATASTKKYFDEIRAGQKDGESNYEYMSRMVEIIKKLNTATTGSDNLVSQRFGRGAQSYFKDIVSEIESAQSAAKELNSEFDDVFGDLSSKSKVEIKAIIDRVAAENDWDQYSRELAYRKFGISVTIDKAKAEQEVSWVDNYLTKFFAQKKYGVTLQIKKISDDKAMDDFIEKGDKEAKAAKRYAELEKRIAAVGKHTKTIDIDESIRSLFNAGDTRLSGKTIEVSTLKSLITEYKNAATKTAEALGVDPFEKQKTKATKAQRDLLNERIQLLKDLANKYEELSKWETKSKALTDVRSYFSDAAKNVGMDITSFVPDKETVAAKIKAIAQQYKELTKRGSGLRIAADLQFDVDKENLKNQLESIKNDVQNSLDGLTLFRKLKDLGLGKDTIKRMFGDEFAESFTDVRTKIQESYNSKFGSDSSKWAPEVSKQYEEEIKKLDKQQYDEQISQFTELTKAYKTQLTEQLQLDKWYAEEKEKIQSNTNLQKNPILKQQYQSNLDKQYQTKTDENTWKKFTGTNTYIEMFQNLEYTSLAAVDSMLAQLERLKESLKGLEPEQVKTIVSQMEKLRDIKMNRYSLVGFAQSMQDIIKAQKEYVSAKDEYVAAQKEKEEADLELKFAEAGLNAVEDQRTLLSDTEYNTLIIDNQENVAQAMERVKTATEALNTAQDNVASKSNRVTNTWMRFGNQIKTVASGFKTAASNLNTLITTISGKASTKTQKWINLIGETTSAVGDVIKAYKDLKNKATKPIEEISDKSKNTVNDVGNASEQATEKIEGTVTSASGAIVSTSTAASTAIQTIEKASVILAIISAALQVAQAIADIFSDEGDIDDFIDSQQLKIEKLQNAYDNLKESVDNAFDLNKLKEYSKQTEANLEKQIALIESQILAEKSRKNPNESTIAGYEEDIEELKEKIKELGETVTEELGGFGSDSNYKSAAEAFAEAWVDAFNDCSSGIEALTDKWDEYFDNLITKQLMMRATTKYIQPLLKAVDAALEETSDGGTALTKSETEYIQKLREASLAGFNEYASELMDALNIKPRGSVELSGLQEGIEGVTEATAQALESILNSMRYYLATQQADVRTIRDTLISRLGSVSGAVQGTTGESSQMITILQEQTGYLKTLANNFDKVIKPNHSKGGSGIKVFLN